MELVLTRQMAIEDATIGVLTVEGGFQCFTLEDLTRDKKIAHETAISPGTYPISLCESPRFSDKYEEKGLGRIVPLLLHVKNYEGVRIHIGNTARHTEGCILVGHWKPGLGPRIEHSTKAYKALLAKLLESRTKVRITVINAIAPADKQLIYPKRSLFEGLYSSAGAGAMTA